MKISDEVHEHPVTMTHATYPVINYLISLYAIKELSRKSGGSVGLSIFI